MHLRELAAAPDGRVNMKILNTAFEAEGLPKVDDPEVMENILNGLDFDPTPEQAAAQAFVARAVLTFLEEGKYDSLADAMDKLGITADELRA